MLYAFEHARILCLLADVLFEVTVEIKPKDWIPHGGSELPKGLLESLKTHVSVGMGRRRKTDGMSQIFMQKRSHCFCVWGR